MKNTVGGVDEAVREKRSPWDLGLLRYGTVVAVWVDGGEEWEDKNGRSCGQRRRHGGLLLDRQRVVVEMEGGWEEWASGWPDHEHGVPEAQCTTHSVDHQVPQVTGHQHPSQTGRRSLGGADESKQLTAGRRALWTRRSTCHRVSIGRQIPR